MGRLIVERIGDEALVYDTSTDRAHYLDAAAAAQYAAAPDDVSRREVIRRLALVGAAAAGAAPLVKSIVAPTPAHAQSCIGCVGTGGACTSGINCVVGDACQNSVCCHAVQGAGCNLPADCCSNNCSGGTCQP